MLGIDRSYHTVVDSVHQSTRVGPDGFVVAETVASYFQELVGTADELRHISKGHLTLPTLLDAQTEIRLCGGGAIIFDQFGRAKFHQTKPLNDWPRQTRRLRHLVANRMSDGLGRFGFGVANGREGRAAFSFHGPFPVERGEW